MVQNLTACLMCFLRNTSIMRTPMPLGKGELMRITTGSFVDGYLKELRKRLLKKSPSSKIGLTTILKNAWTTSHSEKTSYWLTWTWNLAKFTEFTYDCPIKSFSWLIHKNLIYFDEKILLKRLSITFDKCTCLFLIFVLHSYSLLHI